MQTIAATSCVPGVGDASFLDLEQRHSQFAIRVFGVEFGNMNVENYSTGDAFGSIRQHRPIEGSKKSGCDYCENQDNLSAEGRAPNSVRDDGAVVITDRNLKSHILRNELPRAPVPYQAKNQVQTPGTINAPPGA